MKNLNIFSRISDYWEEFYESRDFYDEELAKFFAILFCGAFTIVFTIFGAVHAEKGPLILVSLLPFYYIVIGVLEFLLYTFTYLATNGKYVITKPITRLLISKNTRLPIMCNTSEHIPSFIDPWKRIIGEWLAVVIIPFVLALVFIILGLLIASIMAQPAFFIIGVIVALMIFLCRRYIFND